MVVTMSGWMKRLAGSKYVERPPDNLPRKTWGDRFRALTRAQLYVGFMVAVLIVRL
jgi:hypothetical protein